MKFSAVLYAASVVCILTSVLAGRRATEEWPRERTMLLLGLWAPTLAVFGKIFEDREVRGEENPLHL